MVARVASIPRQRVVSSRPNQGFHSGWWDYRTDRTVPGLPSLSTVWGVGPRILNATFGIIKPAVIGRSDGHSCSRPSHRTRPRSGRGCPSPRQRFHDVPFRFLDHSRFDVQRRDGNASTDRIGPMYHDGRIQRTSCGSFCNRYRIPIQNRIWRNKVRSILSFAVCPQTR